MKEQWLIDAENKISKMPEEVREIRELAFQDLFFFARLVNPGYMYGDIHKEIFKWLQDYRLYGSDDELTPNRLVMLPRAHLKSHMIATFAAWLVLRHPEITILYVSATTGLAETQLFAIKNILDSNVFRRYFPEYINPNENKREKWNTTTISVDHPRRRREGIRDATIETAGLTTNTTGWHADVIIADDLVVPENAYTEDGRESVMKKSSQFTSIRNAGGFTVACGTRYHPSDIYATWRDQKFEVYDDDDNLLEEKPVWEIKEYAVEQDGIFLWPRTVRSDGKAFGFNQRILSRIRGEYEDRVQFYAQYYNDPNDSGSARISRDKFQYYDKKFLKYNGDAWYFKGNRLNVYASIDFAFSLSKKADYTAIVVIGIDCDGFIYILDIDRFKADRISEYFKRVKELHSKWDFRKLRAEVVAAQQIIVQDLKDLLREEGLRLSIEEFRPSRREGSKEERILAALEHRYDNLTIWHYKGGYTDILEEELMLARPAHDDVKDALASVVEIAVKPRRTSHNPFETNVLPFNSRFGGVTFR